MSRDAQSKSRYGPWVLLALFLVQFALCFNPGVMAWDGVFYYTYARSIVFDGDLRLGNDLALAYEARPDPPFEAEHFEDILTPIGRVANPFAIGTALLWLPWFALIYGLARLAGAVGLGPSTLTGYEWPFVWGMATVTCVYGWIGVLTGFRLARKFVGDWAALIASATAMFTTPLVYYQFREPFYAHTASAMTTAFFVAAWWRFTVREDVRPRTAFLLGLLGGLAALVRSQNIIYLALPVLTTFITTWSTLRERDRRAAWRALLCAPSVVLGASLVLTLQFAVWYTFYGRPLVVPQGDAFIEWSAPWVWHVLFSAFHGLLPWVPLTLAAVVGLVLSARRAPRFSIPLLVAFMLQVYVNGCVRDWFGGGGYGARRFSSTLVILLVGYACLLGWRKERWYRLLVAGLGGLMVLHQWLLLSYGFADQIGGHVVSMAPSYEWRANSIVYFWQRLAGYVPLAIHDPAQAIVLPGSPLRTALTSFLLFARQAVLLAGVLGILRLLQSGCRRIYRYIQSSPVCCFFLIWLVALIALADWWLLKRA